MSATKNCLNCRFGNLRENGTMINCWQNPNVVDHPMCINIKKAEQFDCSEHVSNQEKFCRDCKFYKGEVYNFCMNIKLATVDSDGLIKPKKLKSLNDKICELFIQSDQN